jgi:hypothetical protein
MGKAYSTYGRDEKCLQNFGQKTSREEITRKTGVDWNVILEGILEK